MFLLEVKTFEVWRLPNLDDKDTSMLSIFGNVSKLVLLGWSLFARFYKSCIYVSMRFATNYLNWADFSFYRSFLGFLFAKDSRSCFPGPTDMTIDGVSAIFVIGLSPWSEWSLS